MAKAYYSTVFEQSAPELWKIVRDFNNYPVWVGGGCFNCHAGRRDQMT